MHQNHVWEAGDPGRNQCGPQIIMLLTTGCTVRTPCGAAVLTSTCPGTPGVVATMPDWYWVGFCATTSGTIPCTGITPGESYSTGLLGTCCWVLCNKTDGWAWGPTATWVWAAVGKVLVHVVVIGEAHGTGCPWTWFSKKKRKKKWYKLFVLPFHSHQCQLRVKIFLTLKKMQPFKHLFWWD